MFLPKFAQMNSLNYSLDSACPGAAVFHGEIKNHRGRKTPPPGQVGLMMLVHNNIINN